MAPTAVTAAPLSPAALFHSVASVPSIMVGLEEALPYLLALLGAAVFGLHLRVFVLYGKGFGAGVLTRQSLWMLIERYQTPAAISRCSTRLGFHQERRPFLTAFSNGENEVIRGVPENADPLSLLDDVFRWTR